MANAERFLLLVLVLSSVEFNINARVADGNSLVLISKLLGNGNQKPLVAYVKNAHSESNRHLRSSNQVSTPDESAIPFNSVQDAKRALRFMDEIITSIGDENNPIVEAANVKFKSALRSQCQKYIECEVKCKPKKDNCKKSCQQSYDHLKMCDSKDKWVQKTNKEVYEYHKENQRCGKDSDDCKSKSDECKDDDDGCKSKSDECKDDSCKSKSDECKDDGCKSKSNECKDDDDGCKSKSDECKSSEGCN